jgi:hypothetical protein
MNLLPGWNSLDSVSRIHHRLEILQIVALAALVVLEAFALPYSWRKDALVQEAADPRQLTPSKVKTFVGALSGVLKPDQAIQLYGPPNNSEGMRLARALRSALTSSGFKVSPVYEDAPIGGTGGGGILIRQRAKDDGIGVEIEAALGAIGLDSRIVEMDSALEPGQVEIFVSYLNVP